MPARSFRIIFSVASGDVSARAGVHPCSDSPPALARSLWHPAQVLGDHFGLCRDRHPGGVRSGGLDGSLGSRGGRGGLRSSDAALGGGWNGPLGRTGARLFPGRQPESESANHESRRQNVFHGITRRDPEV